MQISGIVNTARILDAGSRNTARWRGGMNAPCVTFTDETGILQLAMYLKLVCDERGMLY
jgi:hypothetical protein